MASQCPVNHDTTQSPPEGMTANSSHPFSSFVTHTDDPHDIDEKNNMPKVAEQKPWPNQNVRLNTERVISSIPKSDFTPPHQNNVGPEKEAEGKWVYPSEQQFFNAMKRKGWQDVREEDMKTVVGIHNAVNERTWNEVLRWEHTLHERKVDESKDSPEEGTERQGVKLVRFIGRPKDISPKARLRMLMGYTAPFDRHDWIIERPDKTRARYVIDFYRGASAPGQPQAVVAFHLDVRPALDSVESLLDRAKMSFIRWRGRWFGGGAQ